MGESFHHRGDETGTLWDAERKKNTENLGLELFSRYLRRVELSRRVGKACRGKGIRSDYGSVRLVLVLVGMLLVGARRLEHLQYVCDGPMLLRFCGLRRLPSRPTIVNWLKQFTGERLKGLSELNGVLVHEQVERLGLNRLTVDMDGTVVQAGNQVGWAFRGFNPHRKKNKSFYPLFAHLAQTGQILKSRNRPGNVHDSKGADAFLRELIGELRGQFGRSRKLEFRTDARTCTHLLNTIRTIRFRIINKAGRLVRVSGRNALRMATNSSTQTLFERIELALAS